MKIDVLLVVDWRGYKGDSFKSIVQGVSFNLYVLFRENNFPIVYPSSSSSSTFYSNNNILKYSLEIAIRAKKGGEFIYFPFPSNRSSRPFIENKKKKKRKKRWEENVRLLIKWRKERDILPRSKLHYKPLNLIFSLHSHEV